jgi:hypothetical protein
MAYALALGLGHRMITPKVGGTDLAAVEEGCRHDVIQDDRGGQEDAQFDRHAVAEHHDQGDRKRGIRTDRNSPSVPELGGAMDA